MTDKFAELLEMEHCNPSSTSCKSYAVEPIIDLLLKAEESLNFVHTMWEKDFGFLQEQDACKKLAWDSPVLIAHGQIKEALAAIEAFRKGEKI